MANVKISQLTAITSSDDLADADIVPIVDSSDSTTKRAALSVLCSYFGAGGGGGGSSVWCTGTNTVYLLTDCVGIGTATPGTDIMLRVQGDSCYTGDLKVAGDVCIGGDDLFMGTNTSGHMLVADGTNFNPVAMSGDIGINGSGVTTIQAGAVENSMLAGSIANAKLSNSSVSYGGVSLSLGGTDATPAFNLCDATGYKTTNLAGTITNDQLAGSISNDKLAGSIANAKLANDSVSYGGVEVDLGSTDATPAFNLCDATGYQTSNLAGTITNAQLAGSIANAKLSNSSVSYGGVSLSLGGTDATPAFNLCDATAYPTSSLVGTITNAQLAGSIANSKLANDSVSYGGVSLDLGQTDASPAFNLCDATGYKGDSALVTVGTIASGVWNGTAIATTHVAGTLCDKTLASPVLCGTISGDAFLDEDNMASNSATKVASQQSIKAYVDSVATGLDLKCSSHVATTANLSATYNNGSSGVGATLTNNSTQAALSIDGQTMVADERVLVKDQSTGAQNGIYTVTTVGDGSTNWVLTRATDFDTSTEITSGAFTFVETGSTNADSGFVLTTDGSITVGTTALTWSQFSGAGQITAGNGLTKSGNTLNVGAGSNLLVSSDAVAMCSIITGLTTVCATNFAGTLATAAQTNVTSLGTLTALTVDNISINGTTIGHTDDTDLITLADGSVTIAGDLTISGDDLTMGTNTSGHILVADGTNYNPVAVSGDVTINGSGAVTIADSAVENSMLAGSIANAKLSNSSVSYGGVSVALGATDATPAFNLCDATGYQTSNLAGTITNAQLAGSIANSKLSNDSVSYGGIELDLGTADATPAFNLCDATGYKTSNLAGTITNAQLAGSIANAKLSNSSITVTDGSSSTAISLGGTVTFSGTSNEVEVGESSGTITVGLPAIVTGLTTVCATNFAGTLATAAQTNVTSLGTLTALTVDNVSINGATIGHTDDTDLMTLADGVLTVSGRLDAASDIKVDAIRRYSDSSTTTKILLNDEVIKLNAGHASNEVVKIESGAVTIDGDLTVCGDDITMGTNTSGHILVADGTNYNPVAVSGDITINSAGAVTIASSSVENSMLAGSIANAKLANDSVSFGGVSVDLGAADATPAFNLCDATAYKGDSALVTSGALNSGSITSGFGNIDNGSSTLTTGAATVSSLSVGDGNITNVGDIAVDTISGDADSNTTIGFPGSDVLTFNTGGNERVRIDASGDVGIGTNDPTSTLHIQNNTANTYPLEIDASDGGNLFGVFETSGGAAQVYVRDASANPKVLLDATGDSYFTGGNVGIGTTAPVSNGTGSTVLSIGATTGGSTIHLTNNTTGTTNSDGALLVQSGSDLLFINRESGNLKLRTSDTDRLTIDSSGATTASGNVTISKDAPQLIMTDSGSGGGTSDIIVDAIGSNHGFYFRGDGSTNHVILESNGDFKVDADTLFVDASENRVGIGTATPGDTLDVRGGAIAVYGQNTTHAASALKIGHEGSSLSQLRAYGANSSTVGKLEFTVSASDGSGGGDIMTITSDGVGVGTATPRANLTVQGNSVTAATFGVDNASGSATLDISALGGTYNAHAVSACTVWFYSPDDINIGGATNNCNDIRFISNGALNMTIDGETRNVGIGTVPLGDVFWEGGYSSKLQVSSTGPESSITVIRNHSTYGPTFIAARNGGGFGTNTLVDAGEGVGGVNFQANDGSKYVQVASMNVHVGDKAGSSCMSGNIRFTTNAGSNGSVQERMRIDQDGNVGIGTTAPVAAFHLNNGASVTNLPANTRAVFANGSGADAITRVGIYAGGASAFSVLDLGRNDANCRASFTYNASADSLTIGTAGSTSALAITTAGEVYIQNSSDQGSYNLQVGGTGVWAAGAYVNGSDETLKQSIEAYNDNALDIVSEMKPVTFEYKKSYSDDRARQIGFIAQDLQKVLKGKNYLSGVVKDDNEHLNVAYQSLIPILTKALQEAITKIETLENKVAVLEATS